MSGRVIMRGGEGAVCACACAFLEGLLCWMLDELLCLEAIYHCCFFPLPTMFLTFPSCYLSFSVSSTYIRSSWRTHTRSRFPQIRLHTLARPAFHKTLLAAKKLKLALLLSASGCRERSITVGFFLMVIMSLIFFFFFLISTFAKSRSRFSFFWLDG